MPDNRKGFVVLRLDSAALSKKDLEKIRDNFSAIVLHDDQLWLGGDEGTCVDRMTKDAAGNFGSHRRFDLKTLLELPGPAKEEVDIEGLDVDGGYLWLIGSHSSKRKKPESDKTMAENLDRLATVEAEGNRFTLARVPLDGNGDPAAAHAGLTAARLGGDGRGNLLTEALSTDRHVGRFVPRIGSGGALEGVPSKDNGFDLEGLAVSGTRVLVGMRGPVLRGWTCIIELRVTDGSGGVFELEALSAAGETYRKHFLQLGGLGVRDLVIRGKDLYVLAGPTMDLDGPVYIYRWPGALEQTGDTLTWKDDLTRLVSVPFGDGKDHAEGLTLMPGEPLAALVCYDSPHKDRLDGPNKDGVEADIFDLGS